MGSNSRGAPSPHNRKQSAGNGKAEKGPKGKQKGKGSSAAQPDAAGGGGGGGRQKVSASAALAVLAVAVLLAVLGRDRLRDVAGGWGLPGAVSRAGGAASAAAGPPHKVVSDARGHFPRGCKWREVYMSDKPPKFWGVRRYEYWDEAARNWTETQPAACVIRGVAQPQDWRWRNGSPRTAVDCKQYYCIYENLWFNNGRFYLLVDGPNTVDPWEMTRNQHLQVLHVDSVPEFVRSTRHHVIPGDTLIFDFVFFLHPTAIGHWSEMLFPLFSILRLEPTFARPPSQFVLLHLKRCHVLEWVRAVLATALGVGPSQDLPPIMWQQEVPSVWKQIQAPLEGYDRSQWVCFERAMVVKDTFTGGVRTFLNREDAHLFRRMVYAQYGLPPPAPRTPMPRIITFQRKRANRRVVNEAELLATLAEFGQVRVAEFNASTPMREQIEAMASTGVLVSVHTSNLANAQFLQPGSAVVELIQRNWIWHNLDKSFQVQTEMMGDIHHYAWRARHLHQTVYINERDRHRFGDWAELQCDSEECVEAHTNVDVVVDIGELRALLADRLPLVFAGWPVPSAAIPWPIGEQMRQAA